MNQLEDAGGLQDSRLAYVTSLVYAIGMESIVMACRVAGIDNRGDQAEAAAQAVGRWSLTAGEQLEAILQEVEPPQSEV